MVEMKSSEVVLSLAAQLASWRAVLVLVLSWATCKPGQRWDLHQYSRFLANCLQQPVWESAGGAGAAAIESRKVGKGRRERRHADGDEPGPKPEPNLGPRGPTLEKQVLKGSDYLDLRLGLERADSVDPTQNFEAWPREIRARVANSFPRHSSPFNDLVYPESCDTAGEPSPIRKVADRARPSSSSPSAERERETRARVENEVSRHSSPLRIRRLSVDPAGLPSRIRKAADRARLSSSSPSAAPVPGWRRCFCCGNGE